MISSCDLNMKPELIEHRDFVIQLTDIGRAVEFCKEHDDEELWTSLIDYSIDKPYFVHVLLHNIGTHVDPTVLIRKIEDGVEIPGLRDSLVQIMLDYRLQVTIMLYSHDSVVVHDGCGSAWLGHVCSLPCLRSD